MRLFILTLPIMTFELITIAGQSLLLSYLMAGLVVAIFVQHKKGFQMFLPLEMKIYLIFIIYCLIASLLFNPEGALALKNINNLINHSMYFAFYLVFVNVIANQKLKQIDFYADFLIMISVAAALLSLFQAVSPGNSIFFHFLRNSNSVFAAMMPSALHGGHAQWAGLNRVVGFAPEPSMWAAYLCIPLSLLLSRLINKIKIKELIGFIILILSFLLSYGRTGWLAFGCAILYLPYFNVNKKHKNNYLIAVTVLVAALIVGSLVTSMDWSKVERIRGITNGWKMFLANPIFGVGAGGFLLNVDNFSLSVAEATGGLVGSYAYNLFVKILAETGIIGFMLWGWFMVTIWMKICICVEKVRMNEKYFILCRGLAIAFISIIISWMNIEGVNFMYIWFTFALISAIYIKINNNALSDEECPDQAGK